MRKKIVPLLPPLEVPTFRYWQCLDCVVSDKLDSLHEIKKVQQQLDDLMNAAVRKTEMQRISEAPLCSSQELKALAETNLEFVDDKRKVHCQDISHQSLPQDKFLEVCFFMVVL